MAYVSPEAIPVNHLKCPKCKASISHNHYACVDIVQLEDALETRKIQLNQLKLQEKQTLFNKYLLLATTTLAIVGFYQIKDDILKALEFPAWVNVTIIIGLAGAILFLIIKLLWISITGGEN